MTHKFRASSLGLIMTDAQSINPELLNDETRIISKKKVKTEDDKAILAPLWDRSLSSGAKTFCENIAKQLVYGYDENVSSKYMEKGILVEDESIELYNSVFFTSYAKNTERRTNDWLTGECDIAAPNKIIDIKSAWSLMTFPVTAHSGKDNIYEWQCRAYLLLWDKPCAEVAYCLVNTPDELVGYEDPKLHYVDHIAPELRITLVKYERDMSLEEKIKIKCESASLYIDAMVKQIAAEHTF